MGRIPSRASRLRERAGLVSVAALLILAGSSQIDIAPAKAQVTCPPQPAGLSPVGDGPTRFTMLIRINTPGNVDTYTNADPATGGLGSRIRAQDIFVINTRREGVTPEEWTDMANDLRAAFPCNRIIALNGLSSNSAGHGYQFALYTHPGIYALMLDWEVDDWIQAQTFNPLLPPWNEKKFSIALARIKQFTGILSATIAIGANPGARAGIVPVDVGSWNYGQIAQGVDKQNRRLGARHLGPQSVQTQVACQRGGGSGFSSRTKQILDQYRFKFIKQKVERKGKKKTITIRRKLKKKARPNRANLSLQISFSGVPDPANPLPVASTSAPTAAACAAAGLKRGAGAFFFFASDDSMRVLFAQPSICALRPPAPGQPC